MFLFGALLNKYEQTKKEKKIFKSFDTPRSNQFEFGNIRIIFNIHKMKKQTNRGKMNSWPVPFFFFSFRSAELILALASIVLCAVHTFIFKLSGQNSKGSRKIDITNKKNTKQTNRQQYTKLVLSSCNRLETKGDREQIMPKVQ